MARGERSSTASRDPTIRSGGEGRYWYLLAGYVGFAGLGILLVLFTTIQLGGVVGGTVLGLFLIGSAFGGLVAFVSLFMDSRFIRATGDGWSPRWWYYLGGPLGVALVSFFIGSLRGQPELAAAFAIILLGIAALVSSVWYLYNRHRFVGVP